MNTEKKDNIITRFIHSRVALSALALALLLLFNLFFTPGFFDIEVNGNHLFGCLIDILKNGAPLMLVSMGMTLVMATGGTDISVGSVAALSAITIVQLYEISGVPLAVAVLCGFLVALLCGAWNGFLVSKLKVQPFITTLMMQVAARGVAYIVSDGRVVTVHGTTYQFFGGGYFLGLPFSLFIAFAVILVMFLFIRKTSFGLYLEAVGSNRTATYFSGIRVNTIIWSAFAVSGLMAGIAGFLLSSNVSSADTNTTGMYLELDAIMACVVGGNSMKGGRFSLLGSFLGALIVRTLTITIYMKGAPSETILLYKALVLIIVGIIQTVDFGALKKKLKATEVN